MEIRDYNGHGSWAAPAIAERYQRYAAATGNEPRPLVPRTTTQGSVTWIYPLLYSVIDGIEAGDQACMEIGVELIEEDDRMPFGRILKAQAARAIRRRSAELTPAQMSRLRRRIVAMLLEGRVPREYREYARLLRRIGLGDMWEAIEGCDRENRYVERWYGYFKCQAAAAPPRVTAGE